MPNAQPCPKCFRIISLPTPSDPAAWVRCPLCGEEYRLQEALDFQPPALELVPEPVASIPISAADHSLDEPDEMIDQPIDDIAEPNQAVLEGMPFDPDLPTKAEQLDAAATLHEPVMLHTDEDQLEAILDQALYDESGESAEAQFTHITEEDAATSEVEIEEPAHDVEEAEPWDMTAESNEPVAAEHDPSEFPEDELQGEQRVAAHDDHLELEHSPIEASRPFIAMDDATTKERPAKKKRSLGSELLKLVVGGVIGLIVGYAVLFFGLKVDLLGIAKFLPPSIVPEQLKPRNVAAVRPVPSPDIAQNPPADNVPTDNTPDTNPPQVGAVTPDSNAQNDTAPPTGTPVQNDATPPTATPENTTATTAGGLSSTLNLPSDTSTTPPTSTPPSQTDQATPAATTSTPGGNPPTASTPTTSTPTTDPFGAPPSQEAFPPLPAVTTPPAPEPQGPKTAKNISLADVSKAIAAASGSTDAYTHAPADSPDMQMLRKNYYLNLAMLAEDITLVKPQSGDDHDQTSRAAAGALVSSVATDRARVEELGFLAGYWLDNSGRIKEGIDGIVLAGTVQSVEPIGKQFRTLIKLFKGKEAVIPVISAEKPNLANGDSAVVIGTIVKDPAQNLYHFDGNDDRVVWGAVVMPALQNPGF